jgi:membrane-bound lytic murein transglycosylase D
MNSTVKENRAMGLLLLLASLLPFSVSANTDQSTLWKEVISGLSIQERKDPRLVPHILWYKKNTEYVSRVLERARPFLYHIVKRIKKRNLPMELALMPAVESAFRAYAYSHGSAAGLWQFIPATGKTYGLKQDWWIDERRSVLASTDAALYFLKDMAREFKGDWTLALAAYNSGAGNVRKALRKYHESEKRKQQQKGGKGATIKRPDFWDLTLPKETQGYVPRILALARFIETHEKYGFKLPDIPNTPLSLPVSTGGQQIDLSLAAELAELPLEKIYEYNPGMNQWATPPDGPHQLLLPATHAERFRHNLESSPVERITWKRHTVKPGESLSQIAIDYHTAITLIRKQNRLKGHKIKAGQTLTIPVPSRPITSYSWSADARLSKLQNRQRPGHKLEHTVAQGETLWDIAREYRVSSRQLAKWNGMAPGDLLPIGKKLVIWREPPKVAELKSRPQFLSKLATQTLYYTVKPNDTLSEIAEKFHTSSAKLRKLNKLNKGDLLQVGQTLTIQLDPTRINP